MCTNKLYLFVISLSKCIKLNNITDYFLSLFQDLYEDVSYGVLTPQTKIKVKVNPSGVVILRADVRPTRALAQQFLEARTPYDPYQQVFQVRRSSFHKK